MTGVIGLVLIVVVASLGARAGSDAPAGPSRTPGGIASSGDRRIVDDGRAMDVAGRTSDSTTMPGDPHDGGRRQLRRAEPPAAWRGIHSGPGRDEDQDGGVRDGAESGGPGRAGGAAAVTPSRAASGRSPAGRSRSASRCSPLGFLIAAQLAAEGPRVRYTSQERTPLVETALAAPGPAGSAEGRIARPPRTDPGDRAGQRRLAGRRPDLNTPARGGPDRRRPDPAHRDRASSSSSRTPTSPCRRAATRATTSSARTTSDGSPTSSGRPAPRRSRSTTSGSPRRPRSSTSADPSSSTRPTSPVRTRSAPSARRSCSPACRPSPGLAGVRQHPARLLRDRDLAGRSLPPSTSRRSPARSASASRGPSVALAVRRPAARPAPGQGAQP